MCLRNAVLGLIGGLLVALSLPFAQEASARARKAAFLKVKRVKPHSSQTLVPLDAGLAITFSRPIQLASVSAANAGLKDLTGKSVPVTYSLAKNGRVLVVTPVSDLVPATDYRFTLRPGVLSDKGTTLRYDRIVNFFTTTVASPFALLRPDQFETLESTMIEGRAAHSAAVLRDGRVLLAGGMKDYATYAVTGDVFDPSTKKFRPSGGQLGEKRAYAPAVEFHGGVMLVAGAGVLGALSSTEIYFPEVFQFVTGPALMEQRDFVAAVALKDGRVLVTGGLSYTTKGGAVYSTTAEIYDPNTSAFRFTRGAPVIRRAGHTLTLLPDGRVLVVGGESIGTSGTAEIFDPVSETFRRTTSSPASGRQLHSATLLDDAGNVLVADGGVAVMEFFDPTTEGFYSAGAASSADRTGATASLLPGGNVLIAGGLQDDGTGNTFALDGMDLWLRDQSDHGTVVRTNVVFPEPRYGHTATSLAGGRVLFAGGFGQTSTDSLATGVYFTPDGPK